MFKYKYPNSEIETKIIILHPDGDITICKWCPSIRQWVDIKYNHDNCSYATISYLEYDCRISDGSVNWCYYSEFIKFINNKQIFNIKEEI